MTITKAQRAQLKSILAQSKAYDPETMQITADGQVTAKHDADKTFAGHNPTRFFVGYAEEVLARNYA